MANKVKARDYILDYGGKKYGLTNNDIGWGDNANTEGVDPSILLGGNFLMNPDYIDNTNSAWADEEALKTAIDGYASGRGMKDISAGYQSPEYKTPDPYADPAPYQSPDPYKAPNPYMSPAPYQSPAAPAAYASPYADKIDSLLNQVLNPENFSYNPDADQGFQAYKKVYNNEGNRAMTDAMGTAAEMTGGRLNSWAMNAGSQAQDVWNDKLMGRIPELMQLAYGMHRDKLGDRARNMGMLQGLDETQYSRHRDDVSDYRDERDFGYNAYTNDRNFGRGVFESDRDFGRGTYEADRNFGRSAYESDRDFGRGTYEADRSYDRGAFESDRDFGRGEFDADRNFNRNTLESDRNFEASEEQRGLDNTYRDERAERADSDSDRTYDYQVGRDEVLDQRYMDQFDAEEKQRIIENAYQNRQISTQEKNQLLSEKEFNWSKDESNPEYQYNKSQADKAASENDFDQTIGPLYQGMMQAEDPAQWLIENSDWLKDDELEALYKKLPDKSDELEKIMLDKLGK